MKYSDAKDRLSLLLLNMDKSLSLKEQAGTILAYVELMGMLPPTNEEKSFQMLPNGEMIYQVNEWEAE